MRKFSAVVVAATLLASMLQGAMPTAQAGGGAPTYYLALGDSLAAGFQPGKGETPGYVGMLWRSVRNDQISSLQLRNVGCSGETSGSLITGNHSPCHYAAASQLNAAVDFLEAHVGEVAFVTIDIGANDIVSQCFGPSGLIPTSCATELRPGLKHRVRAIVDTLATAAPGVPIVGMKYYDPFLGLWGLIPGGRALAHADQRAWTVFNDALASAYEHAGVAVADVAATFRIDDFDHTVAAPGRGRVPVNVALACRWTWFCSARHTFDVHANRTGYRKIATTFHRALKPLLPT
jgi:lysophospholipase L1-like esterase